MAHHFPTLPHAPEETGVWLRLSPTLEENLWTWWPSDREEEWTSVTEARLVQKGWLPLNHSLLPMLLFGRLVPIRRFFRPNAFAGQFWAKQEDLNAFAHQPIMLAFRLPEEELASFPPDASHQVIAERTPPPYIGNVALVYTEEGWRFYNIGTTGEKGRQLQQQLAEALRAYIQPSDWWPYDPDLAFICTDEMRYREERQAAERLCHQPAHQQEGLDRLKTLETAYKRYLALEQARDFRNGRQRIAAEVQWGEITEIAEQLLDLYWKVHRAKMKEQAPPDIPSVFTNEMAWGPIYMPLLSSAKGLQNAASGGGQWENPNDGGSPYYRDKTDRFVTTLELKQPEIAELATDSPVIRSLWERVGRHKDIDVDILLSCIAHWANGERQEDGSIWISVERLLEYRGVKIKTKLEEGGRTAGFQQQQKQDIIDGMERMAWPWITVQQIPRGKRKVEKRQGRLMELRERWVQEDLFDGKQRVQAWRIHPGTWLDEKMALPGVGRQMGIYLQKVLHYNPNQQYWLKRLAWFFTFHLRFAVYHGSASASYKISTLMEQCSLIENQEYAERYPQTVRDNFEKAMNQLVNDEVIAEWVYTDTGTTTPSELPARKWLGVWLDRTVRVTIAPLVLEKYQHIVKNAQHRKEIVSPQHGAEKTLQPRQGRAPRQPTEEVE